MEAWGDEGKDYDWRGGGGFSESTGHFSQLVWKGTRSVGCGRTGCDGEGGVEGWLVVCEYVRHTFSSFWGYFPPRFFFAAFESLCYSLQSRIPKSQILVCNGKGNADAEMC